MNKLELQMENTRNLFFNNDKETYLKFRDNWAKYDHHLNAEHFLLYAMFRGRDPYACFSPITKEQSITIGIDSRGKSILKIRDPYESLLESLRCIMSAVRQEKKSNDEVGYSNTYAESLMAPFKGTMTKEHLYLVGDKITESIS